LRSCLVLSKLLAFPKYTSGEDEATDKKETVWQVVDKCSYFAVKCAVNLIFEREVIIRSKVVHIKYGSKNDDGNSKEFVKRKLHYLFRLLLCRQPSPLPSD